MQQINLKTISGSSPVLDLSNYASFGQTGDSVKQIWSSRNYRKLQVEINRINASHLFKKKRLGRC